MNEPTLMLQFNFFSKKPYKIKIDHKGIFLMPENYLNQQSVLIKTADIQSIRLISYHTYELEIETIEKTWLASLEDASDCYDLYQKMQHYFPEKCVRHF